MPELTCWGAGHGSCQLDSVALTNPARWTQVTRHARMRREARLLILDMHTSRARHGHVVYVHPRSSDTLTLTEQRRCRAGVQLSVHPTSTTCPVAAA